MGIVGMCTFNSRFTFEISIYQKKPIGDRPWATRLGAMVVADKPIIISGHAVFEMKRRGISRTLAEAVIREPGQIVPSVKGREIHQSIFGRSGRMLVRVVVKEDEKAYHVVTAYKTTQVAKYWRNS